MADVEEERPVDGPEEGVVELLFFRKTGNMSGLVGVVARRPWVITMLTQKGDDSDEMLACCVVASQSDAGDLLRFVADG